MIVASEENQKEIQNEGDLEHVYANLYRPASTRTRAEWLRQGYRISGVPTACLLRVHDAPKGNRRFPDEPADPEIVQGLRDRLEETGEPSHPDRNLITRLVGSNQAVWQNLYPFESVRPITRLTQTQAWELLADLWRQGSDSSEHINQDPHRVTPDGRKVLWTDAGRWGHREHKQGLTYLGPKAGSMTRMLVIDLDRHGDEDLARFVERVLVVLRFLQREYGWLAPHVGAINPLNDSCHIVLYFPRAVPVADARELAAELRRGCPAVGGAEIYPDNLSQVVCPLRLDKHVVVGRVLAPCVKAHRWIKKRDRKGRWKRDRKVRYLAHDAVAYWEWVQDPNRRPCDLAAVERLLRGTAGERRVVASQCLGSGAVPSQGRGHGHVCSGGRQKVRFRGNTARLLTGVFSGKLRPDDDTVTVYTTVALRCLRWVERMDRQQAVDWVMGKLEALEDTSFSDRLARTPQVLRRNIEGTAKAVWGTNGYQQDPAGSTATWAKVRSVWQRRGFRLSDETTWSTARRVAEVRELDWTGELFRVLGPLMKAAGCTLDEAKDLLTRVCSHVSDAAELSLSFLENLLIESGVKAYRDKAVAVRRCLEEAGVLCLVRRGFRAAGEQHGVGNHYCLGVVVQFAATRSVLKLYSEEGPEGEASTYPSLTPTGLGRELQRRRREAALAHWYDRLRASGWLPAAA